MAQWSTNAKTILEARYLLKNKHGEVIELPDGMLERVAKAISGVEKSPKVWEKKFLDVMDTLEFLPNSPTLMNAGREGGQLAGCFLLPVEDCMSNIFEQVKQAALIHKSGGGCFEKGTEIIVKEGIKKIEDCDEDDEVLCYDLENKKFVYGKVLKAFKIDVSEKRKVEVELADGSKIICTEDHPFRVKKDSGEEWIKAANLTPDMEIVSFGKTN